VNEVGWLLGPAVVGEAEGRAGRPDDHVGAKGNSIRIGVAGVERYSIL